MKSHLKEQSIASPQKDGSYVKQVTWQEIVKCQSLSENINDVGHQHLNTNSQVMDLSHNNINSGNKNIADHNPGNMNTLMQWVSCHFNKEPCSTASNLRNQTQL